MGKMDGVRVRFEHRSQSQDSESANENKPGNIENTTNSTDNQEVWNSLGNVPYNDGTEANVIDSSSPKDEVPEENPETAPVEPDDTGSEAHTYPVADYIKRQYNVGGISRPSTPEETPAKEPTPPTAEDVAKLYNVEGPDHIPTSEDIANLYSVDESKSTPTSADMSNLYETEDSEPASQISSDNHEEDTQTTDQPSDDWLNRYTDIASDNPSDDPVEPLDQDSDLKPILDDDLEPILDDYDFTEEDEGFEEDKDESEETKDEEAEEENKAKGEDNKTKTEANPNREVSETERRLELTRDLFSILQKMRDSGYLTSEQLAEQIGMINNAIFGGDKNTEPKAEAAHTEKTSDLPSEPKAEAVHTEKTPDLPPAPDVESPEHDSTQAEQKTQTLRKRGRKVLSPLVAAGLRRAQHARVETFDEDYVHTSSEPLSAILTGESDNAEQTPAGSKESSAEGASDRSERIRIAEQKLKRYDEINDDIDEALKNKNKLSSRELYRKYTLLSDEIDDSLSRRTGNNGETDETQTEELKRKAEEAKTKERIEKLRREAEEAKAKEAEAEEAEKTEESGEPTTEKSLENAS